MKSSVLILLAIVLVCRTPVAAEESPDPTQAVDKLLVGKTPSPGTINLFSSADYDGGKNFVRNPNLWCADLAVFLTCFSPWNSNEHTYQGGTLITPRHAIFAEHFSGASGSNTLHAGERVIFVGKSGIDYTRTLKATPVRVGASDVCVGEFTEDNLPPEVVPVQLLGPGPADRLLPAGTPVIFCNKNKEAHVAELVSTTGFVAIRPAAAPRRAPWTLGDAHGGPAYVGDSGSPIFAVIDGRPVLLALFMAPNAGPRISDQIDGISALLGPKYRLNVRKL